MTSSRPSCQRNQTGTACGDPSARTVVNQPMWSVASRASTSACTGSAGSSTQGWLLGHGPTLRTASDTSRADTGRSPAPVASAAMTTPHLVALDIDGTTVNHEGELSDAVRDTVRAVADAGHHVTIATGRAIIGTLPVLDRLGLTTGYAVCANGAVTLRLDPALADGYEILEAVTFDPRPALKVLREHFPSALVAVEVLGVGFKVTAPFPDGELDGTPQVVPFEELMSTPVTRLTLRDPSSTSEEFLARTEKIGLHGVEYAVGWSAWLDINPEGVSRAPRSRASAAGSGSSRCTRWPSATSATTSRCCTGPPAGWRWATPRRGQGRRRQGGRSRRRRRPRPGAPRPALSAAVSTPLAAAQRRTIPPRHPR